MKEVTIGRRTFEKYISKEDIARRISELSSQITLACYQSNDGRLPVFICVLKGAMFFFVDLVKELPMCEIVTVQIASYEGTQAGDIKTIMGFDKTLTGRQVYIVEDIVDTGATLIHLLDLVAKHKPASVDLITLIHKPDEAMKHPKIKYVAFKIPDYFVVGYGMDYNNVGRNLKDIYKLVK